jgi:hypothetical protein
MSISPFARRSAERRFRQSGWGPLLTVPVPRTGEPDLVCQLRLPAGCELRDVTELAQAPGVPEFAARAGASVAHVRGNGAAFLTHAVCRAQDGGLEVLGTVTASLLPAAVWPPQPPTGFTAEPPREGKPESVTEGEVVDSETGRRSFYLAVERNEQCVYATHQMVEELPGQGQVPIQIAEFNVLGRFGPLQVAFTGVGEMAGKAAYDLFEQIFGSFFVGDTPQPY